MHDHLVHFLGVGLRHVDGVTARNAAARKRSAGMEMKLFLRPWCKTLSQC